MPYNPIADSEIDLDSPVTTTLMTKIRDNIEQNRDDIAVVQSDLDATDVANEETEQNENAGFSTQAIQVRGGSPGDVFSLVTDASISIARSGGEITITLNLTKRDFRISGGGE